MANINYEQLPEILQGKVSMGKFPSKPFAGRLVSFMSEVSHAFPEFKYTGADTSGWGEKECISKVAVMCGNQPVGALSIDNGYRNSNATELYVVASDAIDKRHAEHRTKHLKLAMKSVKEHFKVKPLDERVSSIHSQMQHKMRRMVETAKDNLEMLVRNNVLNILTFLDSYNSLTPKPDRIPTSLDNSLGNKWRDRLSDCRIATSVAQAFQNNRGVCVRIETDGALATYDLATKELVEHKSTYDLPTNYQEKITMLKLMDEKQPIEHVGVWFEIIDTDHRIRVEYKYFFLVEGETYVDC